LRSEHDSVKYFLTQRIEAELPDIEITQSIRSLHDIMQEMISKTRSTYNSIVNSMKKIFNVMKSCVKWAKIVFWTTMIAIFAELFAGGISALRALKGMEPLFTTKQFATLLGSTAQIGASMLGMLTAMCSLMSREYEFEVKMKEMQLKQIQMQLCIDLAQHEMDLGKAKGQEASYFQRIIGCIQNGIAAARQAVQDANSVMQAMHSDANKIFSSANNLANAVSQFSWSTSKADVKLQVQCDGETRRCCGWKDGSLTQLRIRANVDCRGKDWFIVVNGENVGKKTALGNTADILKEGKNTIEIYCGDPNNATKVAEQNIWFCKGSKDKGCQNVFGNESWQCAEEWEGAGGFLSREMSEAKSVLIQAKGIAEDIYDQLSLKEKEMFSLMVLGKMQKAIDKIDQNRLSGACLLIKTLLDYFYDDSPGFKSKLVDYNGNKTKDSGDPYWEIEIQASFYNEIRQNLLKAFNELKCSQIVQSPETEGEWF